MQTLLLTDQEDAKTGMRLAGIESVWVQDKNTFIDQLDQAIDDPQIGLILMTSGLFHLCEAEVMERKLKHRHTLILMIPDPDAPFEDRIQSYIRDSIGIKL